jgi:ribosomal protein L14E/L6E/L27E
VVYIAKGPDAGKIAAIIDIIDQNRVSFSLHPNV